ncbi:hypothetical protein H6G89_00170 [Oscillatoria sp. FACHB-1407]|uniref:hypothetical protein n=1 Tax=Oscillatoria sp. FACHB-1407 TaxID=2692847 RepID=UPI0016863962|nr:hypothetical protein [Oscillatoria sp. FACHB-1407]MBD2459446.1 hypothetical protein [Oscillatoria sp. FACHB-1407]
MQSTLSRKFLRFMLLPQALIVYAFLLFGVSYVLVDLPSLKAESESALTQSP